MGHDISAFKKVDTQRDNEIAYLRRNAFNNLNGTIYNLLNCQDEIEPERKFLQECLSKMEGDAVTIHFG